MYIRWLVPSLNLQIVKGLLLILKFGIIKLLQKKILLGKCFNQDQ